MNLGGGSKGGVGGTRRILAPIGNGVLAIIWQKLSSKWSAKKTSLQSWVLHDSFSPSHPNASSLPQ